MIVAVSDTRGLLARCECGVVITGTDEDELVTNVLVHLEEAHPGVSVTRDHILSMAEAMEPEAERNEQE